MPRARTACRRPARRASSSSRHRSTAMSWYVNSSKPTSPVYPDRVTITGRRRNADSVHRMKARPAASGKERGHDRRRPRALHGEEAPVLVVHQVHGRRRLGLPQDLQDAARVRRVRHDEVPLLAHPVDDQVLDHPTALVEDEVVLRLPHLDRRHVVGDDPLEQGAGARDPPPRPSRGGSDRTGPPARGPRGARPARPGTRSACSSPPNGPSFAPSARCSPSRGECLQLPRPRPCGRDGTRDRRRHPCRQRERR